MSIRHFSFVFSRAGLATAFLFFCLLSGCQQPKPLDSSQTTSLPLETLPASLSAAALQAQQADLELRPHYYLRLGMYALKRHKYQLARGWLKQATALDELSQHQQKLALAHCALRLGDLDQAKILLDYVYSHDSISQPVYYHLLRSDYYFQRAKYDDYLNAIHAAYTHAATAPTLQNLLIKHTWQQLQTLTTSAQIKLKQSDDHILTGWAELLELTNPYAHNTLFHPEITIKAIQLWQAQYSSHPAQRLFKSKAAVMPAPPSAASTALMLPLGGDHKIAGAAVQSGFIGAYYEHLMPADRESTADPVTINFLNSQEGSIASNYHSAVQQGNAMIIGPLLRDELAELSTYSGPTVPTIVLNSSKQKLPQNTHSHSLATDTETPALAAHMYAQGYQHTLLISDKAQSSSQTAAQFIKEYTATGGSIIEHVSAKNRFNDPIADSLGISKSRQRYALIKQQLGSNAIRFAPRRRQDIDSIVVAATSTHAKQIIPLLHYHFSGDVPIFGFSSLHPQTTTADLKDLDKLTFLDSPYRIPGTHNVPPAATLTTLKQQYPRLYPRYKRFYALGIDAFYLRYLSYLWALLPDYLIPGANGHIEQATPHTTQRKLHVFSVSKDRIKKSLTPSWRSTDLTKIYDLVLST